MRKCRAAFWGFARKTLGKPVSHTWPWIEMSFSPKPFVICIHAYAGIEHRPEDHGSLEGGYLSWCEGDNVTILSGEELGHIGNTFSNYVFAECKGKQGWCPSLLLARSDVSVPLRWALVHDLQRSQGHNGQVLPVVGKRQDNRFLLLSNGKLLAVREQNVVLFYHDEAESLPQRRKHLLRRLHPDHSGDCYLFHLLGCSSLQKVVLSEPYCCVCVYICVCDILCDC